MFIPIAEHSNLPSIAMDMILIKEYCFNNSCNPPLQLGILKRETICNHDCLAATNAPIVANTLAVLRKKQFMAFTIDRFNLGRNFFI
jgi:hypothetical protein